MNSVVSLSWLASFGIWAAIYCWPVSGNGQPNLKRNCTGPSKIVYHISPGQFPEGIEWDSRYSRFLVGSITGSGRILAVYDNGTTAQFALDSNLTGYATLGLDIDHIRSRVVVAVHSNTGTPFEAVAAYNLDSGKREFLARLDTIPVANPPRAGQSFCNDCTTDPFTGDVYCTDTFRDLLWKVTKNGKNATVFAADPIFNAVNNETLNAPFGLNGIVVHPFKRFILTCHARSGVLFKVPIRNGKRNITVVRPTNGLLLGCDGIRLRPDGRLVVVSSTVVKLVESKDNWLTSTTIETIPQDPSISPTTAALRGKRAYINHAYFDEFFGGNVTRTEFLIQAADFAFDK